MAAPLGVSNELVLSAHLDRQTPIAVDGPLFRHALQRHLQRYVIARALHVVVCAAWQVQHVAQHLNRILRGQLLNHLLLLVRAAPKLLDTFFATSSSKVNRPARRSSSAIRAYSWLRCSSLRNTRWAFSTNSAFQRDRISGLRLYSRHASALFLTPISPSSVTWALNSGVNLRRFLIGAFLYRTSRVDYTECPTFGAHYKCLATLLVWLSTR